MDLVLFIEKGVKASKKDITKTLKFGGGNIRFEVFFSKSIRNFLLIDSIMDEYKYVEILSDNVLAKHKILGIMI